MSEAADPQQPQQVEIELSVVLPCLNEERTLSGCIATIKHVFQEQGVNGEIIVADNGSTDRSREVAIQSGARLVHVQASGYGNALRGGIAAARGTYIIFADADGSYDFMDIPRFLDKLREGNELIMGNRFTGKIQDGAMPWLHQYVGNPVLSSIGRLLFHVPVGDFHCGLRGVSRSAFEQMRLMATGMEFATEMVVKAGREGLRIAEIPIELRPDGRDRPPHLRPWRDGWRHLQFMLCTYVQWLSWGAWGGVAMALFVALLLFAQVWQSGWCNDESAHIPAGLYHLETGRMDAYRVNPPLPRMLATLPLLFDRPKMKWYSLTDPQARNEHAFAEDWLEDNLEVIPRQLRVARAVILLFFALGAWTIYCWTFDLYGHGAALLALALWSLSPEIITYTATVAPDLPAAATGLFACYRFWKWLIVDKYSIPWQLGFAVALATLSKFSWLFLFGLFPVLTIISDVINRDWQNSSGAGYLRDSPWPLAKYQKNRLRFMIARWGKLAISLLWAVFIINLVYGFEGTGRRLADFEFLSTTMGGEVDSRYKTGNRFRGSWLGILPMPVPSEMLQGLDYLKWELECGYPCYLFGEWKYRGWWYFYLVAMGVKFPIGYFVLLAIGSFSMANSYLNRKSIRGEWLVPLVGVLFIVQVSSQTGFTHHLRYVLPAFGFLFILAARSVTILPRPAAIAVVGFCLISTVVFHATHLGQSHTHFNWLAGGPKNGWRYLSLSNLDWGQSTYRMADWARAHPEKRPLTVVFVSPLGNPSRLVSDLGVSTNIRWQKTDRMQGSRIPQSSWYLLSSERLTDPQYTYFRNAKPQCWPFADVVLFFVEDSK